LTVTFPATETVEAFVRRMPVTPLTVRPPPTATPKSDPVVSKVPLTVRRPARVIADAAEIVPLIDNAPKPFEAFRIRIVLPAPLIVTVLEVPVNTEPAPDVSQFPATVQEPEAVIVPDVPPFIVTLVTLTADVPAVRVAPSFTVRFPPVPVRARSAVETVALLFKVRVLAQRSPFVAIVNVAAAVGLNWMLLNSETPRLANVIVRDTPELKTTVPVPADQDPLVDEFDQDPPKIHVAPPKLKNPAAAMLTLPVIVLVPAAPAVMPPAMFAARVATVSVNVPLARTEPAVTVSVPDTSTRPLCVTVPAAEMIRLLKLLLAFRIAMLATPLIVTVLVPFVNTEPAPLVSQLPVVVTALVVRVIVPLVPPVIVTFETDTVDAFAVRIPPLPTFSAPPVNPKFAVARAVVEDPSDTVRVPPQIRARVAIVNVWAEPAEDANVTLLNSLPGRFVPANVIVPPVALLNVTVPVPAFQDADVEAFVHVPFIVHVEAPRLTTVAAVRMSTSPVTVTVEFRAMNVP
jgi:hypothetical protein